MWVEKFRMSGLPLSSPIQLSWLDDWFPSLLSGSNERKYLNKTCTPLKSRTNPRNPDSAQILHQSPQQNHHPLTTTSTIVSNSIRLIQWVTRKKHIRLERMKDTSALNTMLPFWSFSQFDQTYLYRWSNHSDGSPFQNASGWIWLKANMEISSWLSPLIWAQSLGASTNVEHACHSTGWWLYVMCISFLTWIIVWSSGVRVPIPLNRINTLQHRFLEVIMCREENKHWYSLSENSCAYYKANLQEAINDLNVWILLQSSAA